MPAIANIELVIAALPTCRTAAPSVEFAWTGQLVATSTVPLRSTAPCSLPLSAHTGSDWPLRPAEWTAIAIVSPPMTPKRFFTSALASPVTLTSSEPSVSTLNRVLLATVTLCTWPVMPAAKTTSAALMRSATLAEAGRIVPARTAPSSAF